jgi:hypothetical protein
MTFSIGCTEGPSRLTYPRSVRRIPDERGPLQIGDVQPDHLPTLNEVNRRGNSVSY